MDLEENLNQKQLLCKRKEKREETFLKSLSGFHDNMAVYNCGSVTMSTEHLLCQ